MLRIGIVSSYSRFYEVSRYVFQDIFVATFGASAIIASGYE